MEAAAVRRGGQEFQVLVAITILSVLIAAVWLLSVGDTEFAFAISLCGLIGPAIGSSIFLLAESSLSAQEKAEEAFEAFQAALQFATMMLSTALRLSARQIAVLLPSLRAVVLTALQRQFSANAGLTHTALSPRLLVIPFCLR